MIIRFRYQSSPKHLYRGEALYPEWGTDANGEKFVLGWWVRPIVPGSAPGLRRGAEFVPVGSIVDTIGQPDGVAA